jgi:hypothetical protein
MKAYRSTKTSTYFYKNIPPPMTCAYELICLQHSNPHERKQHIKQQSLFGEILIRLVFSVQLKHTCLILPVQWRRDNQESAIIPTVTYKNNMQHHSGKWLKMSCVKHNRPRERQEYTHNIQRHRPVVMNWPSLCSKSAFNSTCGGPRQNVKQKENGLLVKKRST